MQNIYVILTCDEIMSIVNTPLWGLGLRAADSSSPRIESSKWEVSSVRYKLVFVACVLKLILSIPLLAAFSKLSSCLLSWTLDADLSLRDNRGKLWLISSEVFIVGVRQKSLARSSRPLLMANKRHKQKEKDALILFSQKIDNSLTESDPNEVNPWIAYPLLMDKT